MNINDISIGQIVTFITSVGIIAGFCYKFFSSFQQIKTNTKDIEKINKRVDEMNKKTDVQEQDILGKLEETNKAVNLVCMGVSALIDNQINDNKNIDDLIAIKHKLDEKKEIV